MRGDDQDTGAMFSYVSPEARVRPDHPLRPIRQMTDAALERLSRRFDRLVLRHRVRSCCGRCCRRCSTPFGASGS